MTAVKENNVEMVNLLLIYNVNIHLTNIDGDDALDIANKMDKPEILYLLLEKSYKDSEEPKAVLQLMMRSKHKSMKHFWSPQIM